MILRLHESFIMSLTFCLRGRHHLYCTEQKTHMSSVPERNTVSTFQDSLFYRQTALKRWYRTKAVNSLVCKTPKHLRDRVENCLSLPITNASPKPVTVWSQNIWIQNRLSYWLAGQSILLNLGLSFLIYYIRWRS